jgi:hypothetical protein
MNERASTTEKGEIKVRIKHDCTVTRGEVSVCAHLGEREKRAQVRGEVEVGGAQPPDHKLPVLAQDRLQALALAQEPRVRPVHPLFHVPALG